MSAGILEFGAIALYSAVLCSNFARSKLITSTSNIFFSFRKIRTFLGLGAKTLEYNFITYEPTIE